MHQQPDTVAPSPAVPADNETLQRAQDDFTHALDKPEFDENTVTAKPRIIPRVQDAVNVLNAGSAEITEWDEDMIRQLVDTVKVLSADRIRVYPRGGMEIEQTIEGR